MSKHPTLVEKQQTYRLPHSGIAVVSPQLAVTADVLYCSKTTFSQTVQLAALRGECCFAVLDVLVPNGVDLQPTEEIDCCLLYPTNPPIASSATHKYWQPRFPLLEDFDVASPTVSGRNLLGGAG